MAVDFSTYQAPGVYTESVPGPQITVQAVTPTAVGLFGMSVGYRTDTEIVQINPDLPEEGDDPVRPSTSKPLRQRGVKKETVKVSNPLSGIEYLLDQDYTVEDVSLTPAGGAVTGSVVFKRVIGGRILEGDEVQVSYSYTDGNYFDPFTFYDYRDITDAYGSPFDANGNIQSELSLAARLAFSNGAQRVIAVAVNPTDPNTPTLSDYEDALAKLEGESDVSVVVPTTGMRQIHGAVTTHVETQSRSNFERRGIVSRDGTSTVVSPQELITDAQSLSNRRMMLVSPPTIKLYAPELNQEVSVGGQFVAAAVAGLSVSNSTAMPLTRKSISGFSNLVDTPAEGVKNLLSQSGVCVVEKTRTNRLRVRHGVTTNMSSVLTREWSVIGQEDSMVYRLRNYLDADGLIGTMINDLTLVNVKASADSALQSLVRGNVIRNYRELRVKQLIENPDVVEVSFEWQAALPLNYILVTYSLNTTSGETNAITG